MLPADYARERSTACESKYEDHVGCYPTRATRLIIQRARIEASLRSTPGDTSMKEIIKGAIVIDPAFRSEVTLVSIKKTGVFIMPLKFD
jgi:hypothetical protein